MSKLFVCFGLLAFLSVPAFATHDDDQAEEDDEVAESAPVKCYNTIPHNTRNLNRCDLSCSQQKAKDTCLSMSSCKCGWIE